MSPARRRSGAWPTVLALDSSGSACSAAVLHEGEVVAHRRRIMARGHAEVLIPMAIEAMRAARLDFDALDRIAVTVGPGGFTGLRIGLAAARGLGLAASRPVFGVTTFAAVVEGLPPEERRGRHVLVLLDSKRIEIYAQIYAPDASESGPPAVLAPEAIARLPLPRRLLVAGDGAPALRDRLRAAGRDMTFASGPGYPDAAAVARLAARPGGSLLPPSPLYLHPPEATLPAVQP